MIDFIIYMFWFYVLIAVITLIYDIGDLYES